ncbi:dihydroorotase [Microbacterium sp. SORGH_AS_0862]|uniref:dihydroorotase n=1 Tax=Microbacterium sp. SORGH_AS_0862 TaxID=3041789 RepID=UPI00278E1F84|nr:dihydroorotase [Microbacterium sp. SORGH_AS_0862]MDQ1205286.1 dihydroorotase [Microbacterium sp. SORGH_AS_0862]
MILEAVRLSHAPQRVVDVRVERGRIASICDSVSRRSDLVLLPGLVDLHTHLREPGGEGAEDIASGTRAAVAGGYTDVFAMPNTEPAVDSVQHVLLQRELARGASSRVHTIAAATMGRRGRELVDVAALRAQGVHVFSDDGACVDDPAVVEALLRSLAVLGGVFAQHAQSASLAERGVANARVASSLGVEPWPVEAEEAVVARDIDLAAATGGRLHICHVSTAGTVALVRAAKARGVPVTAEVAPHHLLLTDSLLQAENGVFKVNPPLRAEADVEALRLGLRDGTIDIVATDHAPHSKAKKLAPLADAAFGFTGLETALSIVADVFEDADGRVDWSRVADVLAHRPAAIGGVASVAGRPLIVGEPATFALVRAGATYAVDGADHMSASANTPFQGRTLRHRVESVWIEGVPAR